jgi:hypothetical protein
MMQTTAPLPSLFGRFTAILRDHDHLAVTLRQLRALCDALEPGQRELPEPLRPSQLLGALRADLTEHFASEESDAYFGVVLEEAPSLKPQIAALKWEHVSMLRTVEGLCELAEDREQWSQLSAPMRALVSRLEQHERAESALLRRLFWGRQARS